MPNIASIDDIKPEISGVERYRDVVKSGKLYDSHSLYEKHQLYYGAMIAGSYPDFFDIGYVAPSAMIDSVIPENTSVSDTRPVNYSIGDS